MCTPRVLLAYGGWILLGFMTGFHWLAFIPRLPFCLNRYHSYGRFSLPVILVNMLSFWFANIAFWVFRQTMLPWYIQCKGGEDMSVSCLFDEQETRYQAFYVIHLILLLYMLIKWIVDGILLYRWLGQSDKIAGERDQLTMNDAKQNTFDTT